MRVFFVRHGHTFGPEQPGGEKIIQCGCHQNIPLVAKGRAYARAMAERLIDRDCVPSAIYANHLLRTWEHAVLIRETLRDKTGQEPKLILDEHLLELDYGAWAGLETKGQSADDNAVIRAFGDKAWFDWQNHRIIPNGPPHNWQVTEEQIVERIREFASLLIQHHPDETLLVLGSQGTLTFLPHLLSGGMAAAIAADRFKIKPGHYVEFEYDGRWQCQLWNESPC